MRCFDLKPGAGEKEPHTHPWPHWVVIYDGEGVFSIDGVEYPVKRGDWLHVPGEIPHYNYNSSETENFCFLCMVPPEGDVEPLLWKRLLINFLICNKFCGGLRPPYILLKMRWKNGENIDLA